MSVESVERDLSEAGSPARGLKRTAAQGAPTRDRLLRRMVVMLLAAGALGELIYKLGDLREHQFSGLTQHLLVRGAASHD